MNSFTVKHCTSQCSAVNTYVRGIPTQRLAITYNSYDMCTFILWENENFAFTCTCIYKMYIALFKSQLQLLQEPVNPRKAFQGNRITTISSRFVCLVTYVYIMFIQQNKSASKQQKETLALNTEYQKNHIISTCNRNLTVSCTCTSAV